MYTAGANRTKQVLIDHGIAAGRWVEKASVGNDVEA